MGYTHYFKSETADLSKMKVAAKHVSDAIELAKKNHGVNIVYECDEPNKKPIVTEKLIRFNGDGEDGYETFYFSTEPEEHRSWFCKTGRRGYDVAVIATLCILSHDAGVSVKSDGRQDEWMEGLELARQVVPDCKMPDGIRQ